MKIQSIYFKTALALFLLLALVSTGCKKYLNVKSEQKLDIPSNLNDFQALMDNYAQTNFVYPAAGEVSSTDYYLKDADYSALYYDADKRMYTWQKDYIFKSGAIGNDWESTYTTVYFANTILDNIKSVPRSAENATQWDDINGQALFQRGYQFLGALQLWSNAYDEKTATSDLGIPLRLNTDCNQKSLRASVSDSYNQVISDLKSSIPLLPVIPLNAFRPGKQAAYAILARTYLFMRNYEQAGIYADSSLQLNNQLIDYNTLNAASSYPIPNLSSELIFYSVLNSQRPINYRLAKIDSNLYRSYDNNDLRKTIFFKDNLDGTYSFKGNYTAASYQFAGPANDEIYLIRAESYARAGDINNSLKYLNELLINRYVTGTFNALTATDAATALNLVLVERRKELVMRGLRWPDIKRLNKEGAGIGLARTVSGANYLLPPNDPKFAMSIPEDVIALSGMPQNP
jgi:hypothetical protein